MVPTTVADILFESVKQFGDRHEPVAGGLMRINDQVNVLRHDCLANKAYYVAPSLSPQAVDRHSFHLIVAKVRQTAEAGDRPSLGIPLLVISYLRRMEE